MKNCLILDRRLVPYLTSVQDPQYAITTSLLQILNFYIIEEECGGATVLKSRFESVNGYLTPEEYREYRERIENYYKG